MAKRISKGQRKHLVGAVRSMVRFQAPWPRSGNVIPVTQRSWEEEQADFYARHSLGWALGELRARGKVL